MRHRRAYILAMNPRPLLHVWCPHDQWQLERRTRSRKMTDTPKLMNEHFCNWLIAIPIVMVAAPYIIYRLVWRNLTWDSRQMQMSFFSIRIHETIARMQKYTNTYKEIRLSLSRWATRRAHDFLEKRGCTICEVQKYRLPVTHAQQCNNNMKLNEWHVVARAFVGSTSWWKLLVPDKAFISDKALISRLFEQSMLFQLSISGDKNRNWDVFVDDYEFSDGCGYWFECLYSVLLN